MLCEECGKNPATVHYTEIVQGQKTEFHLCETCARDKGVAAYEALAGPFSINQLLSGLLNFDPLVKQRMEMPKSQCPHCGLTFQQFKQIGRFGCPHCYETFDPALDSLLKKIQSSDQHVGKVPKRRGGVVALRRQLDDLKQELQDRIREEKYEEAARLRDRIRDLERQIQA